MTRWSLIWLLDIVKTLDQESEEQLLDYMGIH